MVVVEPQEPIDLRHQLGIHPLSKFHNGDFLIEVQLSICLNFRNADRMFLLGGGCSVPPNNSFKPTLLRGAA